MFIRTHMSIDVTTISPDMSLREAYLLMKQRNFEALPVLQHGKLIGMVTSWDIQDTLASQVITQGSADADVPVSTIMAKRLITVAPEEIIEEAAFLMREHDIWALPVVGLDNVLVGIITEADIHKVLVEMFGLHKPGSRITIRVEDKAGKLAEIASVVKRHNVSIISVATFQPEQTHRNLVVRINTDNPHDIVEDLRGQGFKVVHVSQVWK